MAKPCGEYQSSPSREALYLGTDKWGSEGLKGHEAYLDFIQQLGRYAGSYDTYFSCAITNGGYARDTALSYGQRVKMNTDYSLRIADELAEYQQVDLARTVDAVALGKVAGWDQSDYLVFFLNVMARPRSVNEQVFNDAHVDLLKPGADFDADILNDPTLSHAERRPHYRALGRRYLALVKEFEIEPIDRMIELLDWDMTLGGLVERDMAYAFEAQVFRPAVITYSGLDTFNGVDPGLQAHAKRLQQLGAATSAPHDSMLSLVKIAETLDTPIA